MKITIISSSPRGVSATIRMAHLLEREIKAKSKHEVQILDLREHNLPAHLQHTFLKEEDCPAEFKDLRKTLFETEAFILVSPEYNGTYPATLNNLIDHFAKVAFARKPIAICTASPGGFGGMRAAMQIQQLCFAIFSIPSPHMLVVPFMDKKVDDKGLLIDTAFQSSVDNFLSEYLWLCDKISA